MSKSQIDRLGERLRRASPDETTLRELSAFRQSFLDAYDETIERIREELGFVPTGRPSKSTTAIVEKLKRESIRLGQIQDIAGVRLVVPRIEQQEQAVARLVAAFSRTT